MTHTMLLHPMLVRLSKARTTREVLTVGVRDAIALNGAEIGNVQLIGPCGDLVIVAHANTSAAFLRKFGHVGSGSGTFCERAAGTRTIVHVPDIGADPMFAPFLEFARSVPFTSVVSSPLTVSRGDTVGVLSVHSKHPMKPSRLELDAMHDYATALADRLAQASSDLKAVAHELARQVQPELACGCA